MSKYSFPFVNEGDKITIPSAAFHNAVVEVLNSSVHMRRGVQEANRNLAFNDRVSPLKPVYIRADDDIPIYSIFSIDTQMGTGSYVPTGTGTGTEFDYFVDDMGFSLRYPKAFTKQIDGTETNPPLLINQQRPIVSDHNYMVDLVSDDTPVLVTFDSADGIPNVGSAVGPKPDTYKISTNYTGLTAISGPDIVNERVWVVRTGGGGAGAYIRFEIVSVDFTPVYRAFVDITARPCGVAAVQEEDDNTQLYVYDPCQCFLNEPEVDLIGRCGGARYMQPAAIPTGTGSGTGLLEDNCQWEIDWLCCPVC